MTMSGNRHEPLFDIHPMTGASIEVFFADRLATFGTGGAGWFWWSRRRGCSRDGSPTGPFATSYAAYRHAISTAVAHSAHSLTHNVNADTVRTREIIEVGDLS